MLSLESQSMEYSIQVNQQFNSMKLSFDKLRQEKASIEKSLREET